MLFAYLRRLALAGAGFLLVAALLPIAAHGAAPKELTSCGQVVKNAVLAADLTCSGPVEGSGFAVRILDGGRLDLAGHTLTVSDTEGSAIRCGKSCTVLNGTIVLRGKVRWALDSDARVKVRHVRIETAANDDNVREGYGIRGRTGSVESTTIEGTMGCVAFERVKVRDSKCVDSTLFGVMASRVAKVKGSSFAGSENRDPSAVGLQADTPEARVVVSDSIVSGYKRGVTSWSKRRPKMQSSVCERSAVITEHGYDGTWGVCESD